MQSAASAADQIKPERRQAMRFLSGQGIEIGASHLPLPVNPNVCKVRYVDWAHLEVIRARFPELAGYEIVPTDVVCDVAADGLKPFDDGSLDFVIANHVLEHVPNPLKLFADVHRVLALGGVFFLSLPDKRFSFDRDRAVTPLEHLIEDLDRNLTRVDELHLVDYLTHAAKMEIPSDRAARAALFQDQLSRSIHVHVWTWEAVVEWVRYMVVERGLQFEVEDLFLPTDKTHEVLIVLRRRHVQLNAAAVAQAFDETVQALLNRHVAPVAAQRVEPSAPPPAPVAVPEPDRPRGETPMRYKVADSINAAVKRLPLVHSIFRSAVNRLSR